MSEYDPAADARGSFFAAIHHLRVRGLLAGELEPITDTERAMVEAHKREERMRTKRNTTLHADILPPRPRAREGNAWTDDDLLTLAILSMRGWTWAQIGHYLRRSASSCQRHAQDNGIARTPEGILISEGVVFEARERLARRDEGFPREVRCLVCREPLTIQSRNDFRRHEGCRRSVHTTYDNGYAAL
jgi:hypothetical protein